MTTAELLDTAVTHHRAGHLGQARELYCRVLQADPRQVDALHYLGLIAHQVGQHALAAQCMEQALAVNAGSAAHHNNLGEVYRALGKAARAEASFRGALDLRPDLVEAHTNLGSALKEQGRLDEARDSYEQALRLRPDDVVAINNLGNVLKDQGRLGEAAGCYRHALRVKPDYAAAHTNLLFCLTYDPGTPPAVLFEEHRLWGERFGAAPAPPPHANDADPDRRLRIGYLSGDFRAHAVARFVEPVLARHDPAAVEVFGYAEVPAPDAVTARLQAMTSGWRSTCGLTDERVAALVREDRIDVLVDLAGHTSGNRLRALARGPAPVQITYLGYPNTTGLAAVDYRLTDAVADPPGSESLFAEELIRLPRGFCCFAVPGEAPPVGPLPALKSGCVTFGSPHNLAKLNGAVLDLWAKVLHAVPASRLLLFRTGLTGSARDRLVAAFAARGVGAGRLETRDVPMHTLGYAGYLGLYGDVDVMLDASPASAHTTACEALVMGVPVLALYGDRTYGRLSASVLTHAGLADWVARFEEEYVALAVRWATDVAGLARLRAGLRGRVSATLGDAARFTRSLEDAYRALWRRWCEGMNT